MGEQLKVEKEEEEEELEEEEIKPEEENVGEAPISNPKEDSNSFAANPLQGDSSTHHVTSAPTVDTFTHIKIDDDYEDSSGAYAWVVFAIVCLGLVYFIKNKNRRRCPTDNGYRRATYTSGGDYAFNKKN